jgi:hypothetical protein
MFSIEIKNNKEVYDFCMHNGITDINKFIQDCFKQGFDIRKYGLLGETLNGSEKDIIKEVIVEKLVEIPVEVEKIVEIIKEVPVEKIVEKEILITDDKQVNELLLKIQQLESDEQLFSSKIGEMEVERQIFSTKIDEMENNFQNEMSKKDKELDELRHNLDEVLDKPPVEIIKEVEKIVEDSVTNNKLNMLQDTLQNLRSELQEKNQQITELEKINRDLLNGNQNQGYLLRGSNLNRRI